MEVRGHRAVRGYYSTRERERRGHERVASGLLHRPRGIEGGAQPHAIAMFRGRVTEQVVDPRRFSEYRRDTALGSAFLLPRAQRLEKNEGGAYVPARTQQTRGSV